MLVCPEKRKAPKIRKTKITPSGEVYIINFEEIAYHQDAVLCIINGDNRCISSNSKNLHIIIAKVF